MTKLEICAIEDANPGVVYLCPEGTFYKAYQQSAWLLCTRVHPFKVSVRPLKGLDGPLLSVGFPFSSFDKFSSGLRTEENPQGGGKILYFSDLADLSGFPAWRSGFALPEKKQPAPFNAPFNSLQVYGATYRLVVEVTETASCIERNYRYSLGEDVRRRSKEALLCITLAGKGEDRLANVRAARIAMLDVQLSLRLLNDLKVLPDKRYVYFLDISEDIVKQLSNWERSESQRKDAAGVQPPP